MRKLLVCLSLISLLFSCSNAFAEAKNEEIVRRPSLLSLGDISQAVGLTYDYIGHSGSGVTNTTNEFGESYALGTVGAIRDPDFVFLQLSGGVTYQQQFETTSSTLLNWQYNVLASAFDISFHPVVLNSSRTSTIISNGYTPSYNLSRTGNQVNASFLNRLVPLQFFYSHSTLDTQGLAVDTSTTSDSVGLSAHHTLRDISFTDLSVGYDSSKSGTEATQTYTLSLNNELDFDARKKYQLTSKGLLLDLLTSNVPQRQGSLSESLACKFGPALLGNLSDQYSYSSTQNFDGNAQTIKTNVISASLSHRLFSSLTTSITGLYGQTYTLGGSESIYGGTANLVYNKLLPAKSLLTLTGNIGRTITDQSFQGSQLSARDEQHLVAQQGDSITPNLSGTLISVTSVKSLNPEIVYQSPADYTIEAGKIKITVNGGIAPGTTLFISYTVQVNQNLSFETGIESATGTLSLFQGRYILGADFTANNQSAISGDTVNQALVSSTVINFRADANYAATSFGADYGIVDSTQEKLSRAGAHWIYTTHLFEDDVVKFNFRDTYTMYDASISTSTAYAENVANAAINYTRKLYSWLRLVLSVNVSDGRRTGSYTDLVMLKAGLDGTYRELRYTLNGQSIYHFSGARTLRDDYVHFSITRFF